MTFNITKDQVSSTIGQVRTSDRQEALAAIGQFLVSTTKDNIRARTGPSGAWPRGPLTDGYSGPRIWNDIAQSLQYEVIADGVSISATHIAAGVRQLGTIGAGGELPDIVPVKRKALTIPQSTAAQKASYQGIDARTAFPNAFILKPQAGTSPRGIGVIARYVGGRLNRKSGQKENQKLEILYVLVLRTAIRPHRFLPIDAAGNVAPDAVWNEIVTLITDVYVGLN